MSGKPDTSTRPRKSLKSRPSHINSHLSRTKRPTHLVEDLPLHPGPTSNTEALVHLRDRREAAARRAHADRERETLAARLEDADRIEARERELADASRECAEVELRARPADGVGAEQERRGKFLARGERGARRGACGGQTDRSGGGEGEGLWGKWEERGGGHLSNRGGECRVEGCKGSDDGESEEHTVGDCLGESEVDE